MLKNKISYIFILLVPLVIVTISNNQSLVHTGKLRMHHLIIGLIVITIGGILFVFITDKLLAPKSKKKGVSKNKKLNK